MSDHEEVEEGEEYPEPRTLRADSEEAEEEPEILELHEAVIREHEEPHDGSEPVPVWLILIFLGVAGWGGWYLGVYGAGFRADVFDIVPFGRQVALEPVVDPDELERPDDLMGIGQQVYGQCAACHQLSGEGLPGTFPPLIGTETVLGPPEPLIRIVLAGLAGPIEVLGVRYDGVMPGWRQLGDTEIAAVLTYVRGSWGNQAEPVSPEAVAEIREETAGRDEPWTYPELGL
ncbi:MAG: c-type cytochrome [Bradymonadaceae bacterium]